MGVLTIVHLVSYALAFILLVSLPVRLHVFINKFGQCIYTIAKTKVSLYILVICLALIMLLVLYFREFSFFVVIILHGTAILAIEMSVRELLYRLKAGIYEKCLVVDGKKVQKDEIVLFPTLEYETEPSATLDIVTEKRGTITVFFSSIDERNNTVHVIKGWQKK